MKSRFTTVDIRAAISQMRLRLLGMRVANVYDIDNRTYLIKLAKPDMKSVILIESGTRIHETEFDWPKNMSPSGFSMKMRKHLRTRRLESIEQLGIDRIVDMQFGSGEAAYHIILELYDRGNIVLTDHEYTILNILRPRTDDSQDVRFAVREKYPVETAKQPEGIISQEKLMSILLSAKDGDNLKKTLNPHLVYGPALIEHGLFSAGIPENAKIGKSFIISEDMPKLKVALEEAEMLLDSACNGECKGFVIQKMETKPTIADGEPKELFTYTEFHPFLFKHHEPQPHLEYENFNKAVDDFFSKVESQKLDMKALQQEKQALKKLENVRKDHDKRLEQLQKDQDKDKLKAQLIEINLPLVDKAILIIKSALANQIDWTEINGIVKEAQAVKDPVAGSISSLRLDTNHITMLLRDPFADSEEEEEEFEEGEVRTLRPMMVDIDLSLSAYANARKYYDMKRHAATKEQKTVDASSKAMKSAEKKTKLVLKEVQTTAAIKKTRKTYWFEKFLWFVSSENYLMIGGRDQQQNELIVKRYLRAGDVYVHADLHGASSVIIKNPSPGDPVPPKTLNEAGTMAICNSAAWDAKVVTSAWWVNHDQVSKTAPTGEYLTTGSFMIRGKKNFLPPSYLIYGFGLLFKVDEESIFRHQGERRVRAIEEDAISMVESEYSENAQELEDLDEDTESDSEPDTESKQENSNTTEGSSEPTDSNPSHEMKGLRKEQHQQAEGTVQEDTSKHLIKDRDQGKKADSGEIHFPDTNIQLQHVKGEQFTLQRTRASSQASYTSQGSADGELDDDNTIYLGDDQPIVLGANSNKPTQAKVKLSAKQRREMKKKAKETKPEELENDQLQIREESDLSSPVPIKGIVAVDNMQAQVQPESDQDCKTENVQPQAQLQHQQPKRGKRAKMKKIKEKYGDQDEEERQLRMEILASAGAQKEEKKKKGRKGKIQEKELRRKERLEQEALRQGAKSKEPGKGPRGPVSLEDIKAETSTIEEGTELVTNREADDDGSDDEKKAVLEEENVQLMQDAGILDTLTGQPVAEDNLLNCVVVCAPYSALVNYKYKVKLLPGSTKRGKAAKIAMNMFMHDKGCTAREKDLLRSMKDADVSRNIPGKVKVSAPNLHKAKKK